MADNRLAEVLHDTARPLEALAAAVAARLNEGSATLAAVSATLVQLLEERVLPPYARVAALFLLYTLHRAPVQNAPPVSRAHPFLPVLRAYLHPDLTDDGTWSLEQFFIVQYCTHGDEVRRYALGEPHESRRSARAHHVL